MKYLIISVAFFCNIAANAQDVSTANWAAAPVTVDGNANEWHQPLNLYDTDTKLLFAMSNDSTHIYLCFESKDDQTQRKIMRAGMSVELDFKGKTKRSATIAYPLPPKERDNGGDDMAADNTDKDNSLATSREEQQQLRKQNQALARERFLTDNLTMQLSGFASVNGMVPVRGRDITAAMNWDSTGNLFYEIAIPIKQLIDEGYTAEQLTKEITLEVRVMALPQSERHFTSSRISAEAPNGGGNGANSFGGGGRGMHGGGGGFGGGGIPDRDRAGLYKTTYFKQKFVLAGANAATAAQ